MDSNVEDSADAESHDAALGADGLSGNLSAKEISPKSKTSDSEDESARGSDDNDNDEAGDDGDDDDGGASDDESSSSSGSSEGSNDEDDGEDNNPDGLSQYERLRLDRIKRNNERLRKLGLLNADGQGTMVGAKKHPNAKKKRRRSINEQGTAEPSRRSRRSTGSVNYNENALLSTGEIQDGDTAPQPDRPKREKKKEGNRNRKLPRDVYLEFKRIESHKKRVLKQAERDNRSAEVEYKHWERRARIFERREDKRLENEERLKELEEERKLFGKTGREWLAELDGKMGDVRLAVSRFDARKRDIKFRIESQARSVESKHKIKVLESMNTYPRSIKEAVKLLNSCLVDHTPNDAPPSKRSSKRKSTDDMNEPPVTKKAKQSTPTPINYDIPLPQFPSSISTVADRKMPQESRRPPNQPEIPAEKTESEKKTRQKREVNVGGWMSPEFAAAIDRSWLETDKCGSGQFNLKGYVPQVGDIVLYYPSGHRDFLEKFPDNLGKGISRLPLWERARKERQKASKVTPESHPSFMDTANPAKSTPTQQKGWWNDEWLDNFLGSVMMNYPLVCRVEKTQAEFPDDPNQHNKLLTDGQVMYKSADAATKAKMKGASLRLAVTLRSFTPLVPPKWTEAGPVELCDLEQPPWFTAVTFPTVEVQPYLIPFCWAYLSAHSLSPGDDVVFKQSKAKQEGNVRLFSTLGDAFGTFRLDDKASFIGDLLTYLEEGSTGTLEEKIEQSTKVMGRGMAQKPASLPIQHAMILVEFMSTFARASDQITEAAHSNSKNTLDFMAFLRSTLPLWNWVCLSNSLCDRRTYWVQPWQVRATKARVNNNSAGSDRILRVMKKGLIRSLDDMLRMKIECTLDDFLLENDAAELFRPTLTDVHVSMYSSAVPVSTSFDKVLKRLKGTGKGDEAEATCYYRSHEHCMQDINTIELNCMLYNDQDSYVVQRAHEVIPKAKRLVSNIISQHFRDREEKPGQGTSVGPRAAAISIADTADARKACQNETNPFDAPFTAPLYREWIQCMSPDGYTLEAVDQSDNRHVGDAILQWMPQAGDPILYSRSLHVQFIDGHAASLRPSQCVPPEFDCKAANKENDGAIISGIESDAHQPLGALQRTVDADPMWIAGHVTWVRAVFPRAPSNKGDYRPTFVSESPLLALGLCFPESNLLNKKSFVLYWRPCVLPCDGENPSPSNQPEAFCKSCGVGVHTSFLRPRWPNTAQGDTEVSIPKPALSPERLAAIDRCFCLFKRRCLTGVAPDSIDENLTSPKVKKGYLPRSVRVGKRSLPTYEDILKADCKGSSKTSSTTGVSPKEAEASLSQLVNINYLPPWLPQSQLAQVDSPPVHEALSPWPKLCLELILLRLQNGYYRHLTAIENDITEGYVNSVLLLFGEVATRKKLPISIRKIARSLCLSKKFDSMDLDDQAIGNSTKGSQAMDAQLPGMMQSKNVNGNAAAAGGFDQALSHPADVYTDEERYLLGRISRVRRLYAVALVSVSETTMVQHLFGLTNLRVCRQSLYTSHVDTTLEESQATVREQLALFVAAMMKDPGQNRIHLPPSSGPPVRIKFTCGGAIVNSDPIVESISQVPVTKEPNEHPSGQPPPFQHGVVDPQNTVGEHISTHSAQELPLHAIEQAPDGHTPPVPYTTPSSALTSDGTQVPLAVEIKTTVLDGVELSLADYERDEPLMRLLFGRVGRMNPCARCQVTKKSMVYCRVKRGHSNADFDIMSFFKGMGNLEEPLRFLRLPILLTEKAAQPTGLPASQGSTAGTMERSPVQAIKADDAADGNEVPKRSDSSKDANTDNRISISGEQEETKASSAASASRNNVEAEVVLSQPEKTAEATQPSNEEKQKQVPPASPGDDGKDEVNSRDYFEKATHALALAKRLLEKATAYAKADARLSQEFVDETLPYDKTDKHYACCVICGHCDSLLLCEGCHNVAHYPCAGLEKVPTGDFYCDICVAKKKLFGPTESVPQPNGKPEASSMRKESLKNIAISTKVLEAAGIPTFDDKEQEKLSKELDILFMHRTGKERGTRQEASTSSSKKKKSKPTRSTEPSQNLLEICVGTKFVKAFEQGDFTGEVLELPSEGNPYFHVRYEDDDEEELTREELLDLISPPAPKKRGRPKKQPSVDQLQWKANSLVEDLEVAFYVPQFTNGKTLFLGSTIQQWH